MEQLTRNTNILIFILMLFAVQSFAWINPENRNRPPQDASSEHLEVNFRSDCAAPTEQQDLNINNVRARLLTGGDLWWDLQDGLYIVPNVPVGSGLEEKSSIFAGGVWLGGLDPNNNLKLAASTYRGGGQQDFYTGPLDPTTGLTCASICSDWDVFFTVHGADILNVVSAFDAAVAEGHTFNCDALSDEILGWPGRGNPNFPGLKYDFELPDNGQGLASFWDQDSSGTYNPCMGDFPIIDIRGCEPLNRDEAKELVPDQMIFWIYNDAGAEHTLTQGASLNMEIQVQAYAYATSDEINDMTFYRYKLINRGLSDLKDTYFAMWVDPDLGCSTDDYVGCDVERSMAYTYNEDVIDGTTGCECSNGANTYCDQVPIIGTDYFRGPLAPKVEVGVGMGELHVVKGSDRWKPLSKYSVGDTIYVRNVNLGSQIEPDIQVELGMSSFTYYNNGTGGGALPATTDPRIALEYYNYMRGLWREGTPFSSGGSGFNPGSTDTVKFAFPGNPNDINGWSMCSQNEPAGDRRTVQASGPFLLQPGATNELIIGAVWVPDMVYPCPDITRLQRADDLAQALFDNCFDIPDGPDAPDMCAIELDQEIVLVLSNDIIQSNNAFEDYSEVDILAPTHVEPQNAIYEFEGYQIFQLAGPLVSAQQLDDIEQARLVHQVDIKNGVSSIYNWEAIEDPNPLSGQLIWIPHLEVEGLDKGVRKTFRITEDAFSDGDNRLVNHTKYYFMVVAYGYNNYETFDPGTGLGQRNSYLQGRRNVKILTALPRPMVYQGQNAEYGDGPIITRLDGVGIGGNFVELDESMYDKILEGTTNREILYKEGAGPISVDIYNPLEVVNGDFQLEILGDHETGPACGLLPGATWLLTDLNTNQTIASAETIDVLNEQLLPQYGFSINIVQTEDAGSNRADNNGVVGGTLTYEDERGDAWYNALKDDGRGLSVANNTAAFVRPLLNFLRTSNGEPEFSFDTESNFSDVEGGNWYPFLLTAGIQTGEPYITPAWKVSDQHNLIRSPEKTLADLNNVDIVFTSDKSKWSRCVVVETASEDYLAIAQTEGDKQMLDLRAGASVDKNGNPDGDGEGMSWFPGYAVDVETGERLNIFFGENSTFNQEFAVDAAQLDGLAPIGTDMMYNPTSQFFSNTMDLTDMRSYVLGGGHYVYVTREIYDGCAELRAKLAKPVIPDIHGRLNAYKSITWCSMTLLNAGTEMLSYADGAIPNDCIVKLRVDNPYNLEQFFNIASIVGCKTVGANPKYQFSIVDKAMTDLVENEVESALDNIRAVPNPYYGISSYETSQLTTTVKITNLPARCDVTIFSLDGKFIRQFKRDERGAIVRGANPGINVKQGSPDLEWDLNNQTGVPIASGVYLIHINAIDLQEETTIKWFGVNRQFDPSGL